MARMDFLMGFVLGLSFGFIGFVMVFCMNMRTKHKIGAYYGFLINVLFNLIYKHYNITWSCKLYRSRYQPAIFWNTSYHN